MEKSSAFAPFASRPFTVMWGAALLSNIGTAMNATAAGWLMTELAPTPLMVSMVQAASTLPLFLFALLAGALADLFDKRRLLLLLQSLMTLTAALLAAVVWQGLMTPGLLLMFTFLMATGAAFVMPAWQSITPKLVDRPLLPQAVALNSMGLNVARAVGPALAGGLIAVVGIALPFAIDTLSFVAVILALWWWTMPKGNARTAPPEHVGGAIVAGLRYAAASPELKATLVRAGAFFLFASAPWSLLPLIARVQLGGGPETFGLLMGGIGVGAVAGALVMPKLKGQLTAHGAVVGGTLGIAAASIALGFVALLWQAVLACLLVGVSWIFVLSSLNVSAQLSLPDWVRARGLAIFSTVFFGAMTLGSLVWGHVGELAGFAWALVAAGVGAVLMIPLVWRVPLQAGGGPDLAPSGHWPEPVVAAEIDVDRGPVLVSIEYKVDPATLTIALAALRALEPARRRGGATHWSLFEDASQPGRIIELFEESSWAQHLRHHNRVTEFDKSLQAAALAFHIGNAQPKVTHWIAPDPGAAPPAVHPKEGGLG